MGMFDWVFIRTKNEGWGEEEEIDAFFQTKCLENKLNQYEIINNEIILSAKLDGCDSEKKKIDYSGLVFIYGDVIKEGVESSVEYRLDVEEGVIKKGTLIMRGKHISPI